MSFRVVESDLPPSLRAAGCRPLRQPRWLPLHPQADAKQVPATDPGGGWLRGLKATATVEASLRDDRRSTLIHVENVQTALATGCRPRQQPRLLPLATSDQR